jgi:two-component system, OmpR family, response regulator
MHDCRAAGSDTAPGAAPARIAVFEPDPVRAALLMQVLGHGVCRIVALGDPALSVRDWLSTSFDIVLINPFASVGDAGDVITIARRIAATRPVLALTNRESAVERTMAIAAGADDAMEPVVAPLELAVRVNALLRRRALATGLLACDELRIDLLRRSVQRGSRQISMPAREFELLAELAKSSDEIVPRKQLLQAVWRLDFDPGTNRVEVHVSRLRGRLDHGEHWPMLRTYKGRGYALVSRHGLLDAPTHAPLTLS